MSRSLAGKKKEKKKRYSCRLEFTIRHPWYTQPNKMSLKIEIVMRNFYNKEHKIKTKVH